MRSTARIANRLLQVGAQGERVVLLYDAAPEYIAAFLGVLQAGAVAVPTYPPLGSRPLERLAGILQDARPQIILTTGRIRDTEASRVPGGGAQAKATWIATDELPFPERPEEVPVVRAQPLAMLQYTSGSSGVPKGVMVTHQNLLANCEAISRWLGPSSHRKGCIWLPLFHDMGLLGGVLQPIHDGFPLVFMSPLHFIQDPVRWLRAISEHRITLSGAPNFGYELCTAEITDEEMEGLDLSCWTEAFCGSEPVRRDTLRRFAARFTPRGFQAAAFNPCYGLAEATLLVSGKRAGTEPRSLSVARRALEYGGKVVDAGVGDRAWELVSSGTPDEGLDVRVVHPETCVEQPEGCVGEIWVSGPTVAAGYWERQENTQQAFGATLPGSSRRYLRTGDLGFLRDQELFISGRLKSVIIIAGRNHYPEDIEATVEAGHSAVRRGGVAAFPVTAGGEERLVLAVELKPMGSRDASALAAVKDAIVQAVTSTHGVCPLDILFGPPGTIPRTTSGKVQRESCCQAYLNKSLPRLRGIA